MTMSSRDIARSLELFEVKPGTKVQVQVLQDLLPDTATALFFGKVYKLDYRQLSHLLLKLFDSTIINALLNEGHTHSHDLQDYIIDIVPPAELQQAGITPEDFTDTTMKSELLVELWQNIEVQVASSIQEVIDSLDGVLTTMQCKNGEMIFSTLAKLNRQRQQVIGSYEAQIRHRIVPDNLVVFDVSGSMTRETVEKIVGEVLALAFNTNATLAIVSNSTFMWEPGTYSVDHVMAKAEFGGTQYETLADVFQKDWSTVITIADYDSSMAAKRYLARCTGRVQQVLDISLVDRPTFLAECIGQLANEVKPILVGSSRYPISPDMYDTDW